jgi:MFS family permease
VRSLVAWLWRWGISIASLVGGLLTLFVFRRGLPHVGWIVGSLLLLWLLVTVLVQARDTLQASERRAHRLVLTATEYTVQTLYHGVLLFLLPAYWAASTLRSPNVALPILVAALALLATIDPWYRTLLRRWPWIGSVFFLVSVFGGLNLALPLVGVAPFAALLVAAFLSVVGLTPTVRRMRGWRWTTAVLVTTLAGLAAAATIGRWCVLVPPAPMFMARAELGWTLATLESLEPTPQAIHEHDLHEHGLVARTAIYAPAGLRQPIEHVWRRDGRVVNVVRLTPVLGGRREGFRTFSRKTAFPSDSVGRWSVDVTTEAGQLIGRVCFRVVP